MLGGVQEAAEDGGVDAAEEEAEGRNVFEMEVLVDGNGAAPAAWRVGSKKRLGL